MDVGAQRGELGLAVERCETLGGMVGTLDERIPLPLLVGVEVAVADAVVQRLGLGEGVAAGAFEVMTFRQCGHDGLHAGDAPQVGGGLACVPRPWKIHGGALQRGPAVARRPHARGARGLVAGGPGAAPRMITGLETRGQHLGVFDCRQRGAVAPPQCLCSDS